MRELVDEMSSFDFIKPYNADGSEHPQNHKISTEESIECPFCFVKIEIQLLRGIFWHGKGLQVFLKCKACKESFVGYTQQKDDKFDIIRLSKGNHKPRKFQKEIEELSQNFVKIYGEAEFAEHENLTEICGVGYRKALEFLIKDYLIKKSSEKEKEIKKKSLGDCIKELIDNTRIKEIAKRATWLGNDETHYFRKWEDKDLEDLKRLIEITVHFITMEIESDRYMGEMKDGD